MEAKKGESTYEVPKNSWNLLLAFSLFAFVTQIGYVHLPSIVNSAATYYNCTPEKIMTFSNIFPLFSCLLGWLPFVVLRLRFDRTVITCSLICTAGFWITYMAMNNYDTALLGHLFLSLSGVFSLSPAIYIAERYFSPEKKALAIAIPYYFSLFGTNFGFLTSTNMIAAFQINHINFVYAIIGSVQLVLCAYALKHLEPILDQQQHESNRFSLKKEFAILTRKPSAVFTTVVLSVFSGVGSAITTLIAFMFTTSLEKTMTDQQIGIAALVYNTAGAVFGISISKIIEGQSSEKDRQTSIRSFFQKLYVMSSLSSIVFAAYCNYARVQFPTLCLILFLLGGSLNGSYSVILEFITNKYGLSELLVAGLFNMSSSLISYVVIVFMSTSKQAKIDTYLLALLVVMCSCSLKMLYFRYESKNITHFEPLEEKGHQIITQVPKDRMILIEERVGEL